MKVCKNCSTQLKDGEIFCGKCGTKAEQEKLADVLKEAREATTASETTNVSEVVPTSASELKPAVTTGIMQSLVAKKKKPIALISAITAAIVVVGIGAAMLLSGADKSEEVDNGSIISDEPSEPDQIPNAARMQLELSQDGRSFVPNTHTIDSLEILSEETEDEDEPWVHYAAVIVNSNDTEINYVKYGVMTYQRDEEKEWILASIDADRRDMWSISPAIGVKEAHIESCAREILFWQTVTIDGDEWLIDENTIESIKLSNQNTDLKNHTDVAIVTVVLGSEAKTAEGQVELDFVFENAWTFTNHRGHAPFESQYRASAEYELTSEHLLEKANHFADCTASEFLKRIKEEIDAFAGSAEQADDITMLALEIK